MQKLIGKWPFNFQLTTVMGTSLSDEVLWFDSSVFSTVIQHINTQNSEDVLAINSYSKDKIIGNVKVTIIYINLGYLQEMHIQSLGLEYALEKKMATHSRILAWKIPWTEKPGRLQSMGSEKVEHEWAHTHTQFPFHVKWILQERT